MPGSCAVMGAPPPSFRTLHHTHTLRDFPGTTNYCTPCGEELTTLGLSNPHGDTPALCGALVGNVHVILATPRVHFQLGLLEQKLCV